MKRIGKRFPLWVLLSLLIPTAAGFVLHGFTWQGAEASLQGGSYGHGMVTGQWGMADGAFSFYGAAEGVTDEGWRFHSQSNLVRLYANAGWRFGDSEIHLVASGAATGLGVVGPTPLTRSDFWPGRLPPRTHSRSVSTHCLKASPSFSVSDAMGRWPNRSRNSPANAPNSSHCAASRKISDRLPETMRSTRQGANLRECPTDASNMSST